MAWRYCARDWDTFNFRYAPESGAKADIAKGPSGARWRLMRRSKREPYSITMAAEAAHARSDAVVRDLGANNGAHVLSLGKGDKPVTVRTAKDYMKRIGNRLVGHLERRER